MAQEHQEDMGIRSMMRHEHVAYLERQMPEGTRLGKYVYARSIPAASATCRKGFTKLCALENEMGRLPDWFITCT